MKFVEGIAVLSVVLGMIGSLRAQVVTPMELSDPKTQQLQQRHLKTLMAIGTEIEAHKFPYPFYFPCRWTLQYQHLAALRSSLRGRGTKCTFVP
jgi:hypothetical protein